MKTLILILLLLLPSVYGEGYKLQYRQIFAGIDKDSYWGQYNQLNFAKEKYFSLSESVSLDIEAQSILNQGDLIFLQNSSGILNQGNTTYFPLNLNLSEGDNHRLDFNLSKLKFQIQREMWGLNFGRFNVNWGSHLFFSPNEWWSTPSTQLVFKQSAGYIDGVQLNLYPSENTSIELMTNRYKINQLNLSDSLLNQSSHEFQNYGFRIETQWADQEWQLQGAYIENDYWAGASWYFLTDPYAYNIEYSLQINNNNEPIHRSLSSIQYYTTSYGIYQLGLFINNQDLNVNSLISTYNATLDPSLFIDNGSTYLAIIYGLKQLQLQYIWIQSYRNELGIHSINTSVDINSQFFLDANVSLVLYQESIDQSLYPFVFSIGLDYRF